MLHMLQWLCTYVASVYPQCFIYFLYTYVASVSFVFFCMLQVLHLDVSKVDRDVGHVVMVVQVYVPNVLDILDVYCKSRSGVVHVVVGPISRSHLLAAVGPRA